MLSGRATGSITPRRFISIFAVTVMACLLVSNVWTNLAQPGFQLWREKQQLQADVAQLEREQQRLLGEIQYRQTATYIIETARKLLMAWPGERIFVPVPQAEPPPEQKAPSEEQSQTQPPSLWQQFQNWLSGGP